MSGKIADMENRDLREKANFLRYTFVEEIDKYLLSLESSLLDHGMNVRWAQSEQRLCESIEDLLPQKQYNRVCFDLPSIPTYFQNSGNLLQISPIESVSNGEAEVDTLIVNADFAISSNGSLIFIDKKSKNCFNNVNNVIVIVNIDDILISHENFSLFLSLKGKDGKFPDDVKIITKPYEKVVANAFQSSDTLGYTKENVKISVILYENGISELLNDVSLRDSLYCINCGKCLEVCPVANASHKMSPIDIIKKNCLDQYNHTQSIFKQTTLCGNCQDVCPVNIPMTDMLIYEMNIVNGNVNYARNKQLNAIFSKRSKLNNFNKPLLKAIFLKHFFGKNSMLHSYFKKQKDNVFYNIARNIVEENNEQ